MISVDVYSIVQTSRLIYQKTSRTYIETNFDEGHDAIREEHCCGECGRRLTQKEVDDFIHRIADTCDPVRTTT